MSTPSPSFVPPYSPSWANWFTRAVERLPGPNWYFYFGLWLVLVAVTTLVEWSAGAYPIGALNIFHIVFAAGIPYMLALIHYLRRTADAAMEKFRPVLNVTAQEYQDLHYQLTVLPARTTLIWMIILISLSLYSLFFTSASLANMQIAMTPLSIGWAILLVVLWDAVGATWFYQMYRQMRMVNRIYTDYARLDIFDQSALYGFSGLLACAALGIIIGITVLFVVAEWLFADILSIASVLSGLILAAAIFILPLLKMHERLVNAKEHLLGETNRRIKGAISLLNQQVDAQDAANAAQTKDVLAALELEQRLLEKIPTWPWAPETIRLLISALLFPLVLFAIQYIVQNFAAP